MSAHVERRQEFQRTGIDWNNGPGPELPVCPICFALMPERNPQRHIEWHGLADPARGAADALWNKVNGPESRQR